MDLSHFLEASSLWSLPLVVIQLGVLATLMLAHELGLRLRRWTQAAPVDGEDDNQKAYLATCLTLLVLLLGFSFSMALDQYGRRRAMVNEEALAISTTYRRMQAVEEPTSAVLRQALIPYIVSRDAMSRIYSPAEFLVAEAHSDVLEAELWAKLVGTIDRRDLTSRQVLDAASQMFNIAHGRRAAIEAKFPRAILASLLLYATLIATFIGYSRGSTRRYLVASTGQFLLLALVITLILDLDRERSGLLLINQAPIYRAVADIRRSEARAKTPPRTAPGTPAGIISRNQAKPQA